MKNYKLTEQVTNEFFEILETFEYIQSKFPTMLVNYYEATLHNVEECVQRAKSEIVPLFAEEFRNRHSGGLTGIELLKAIKISAEKFEYVDIDIDYALKNNLLIETKTIELSDGDLDLILRSIRNYSAGPQVTHGQTVDILNLLDRLENA